MAELGRPGTRTDTMAKCMIDWKGMPGSELGKVGGID